MHARLLIAALVLLPGCKVYQIEEGGNGPPGGDYPMSSPPARHLAGTGVVGTVPPDGSATDTARPVDASVRQDTRPPDLARDTTPDRSSDTGPGVCLPCDPVAQDCPLASQACYTRTPGVSCCEAVGGAGSGSPCLSNDTCDRGLICVSDQGAMLCRATCDPVIGVCLDGLCRTLPGYQNLGYCAP